MSVSEKWSKAAVEAVRQARVNASGILWRGNDPRLAAIVSDTAARLQAPIAYLSILDGAREWVPVAIGMETGAIDRVDCFYERANSGGAASLCALAGDPLFSRHPWLAGPPAIAFAGWAPLVLPTGETIGALCLLNDRPRATFSTEEIERLSELTEALLAEIHDPQAMQTYGSWSIDLLVEQIRDAASVDSEHLILALDAILRDVERAISPGR